jgi:hypothetical protein
MLSLQLFGIKLQSKKIIAFKQMNKYNVVASTDREEEEREQREERAMHDASQMCPCGSQFAGIFMGLFCAITIDVIVQNNHFTLLCMASGSAFATLGSQHDNPFDIPRSEFILVTVMMFISALVFSVFFPVDTGIGNLFVLSAVSSTTVNYIRPILLIPLSMGYTIMPEWMARVFGHGGKEGGKLHKNDDANEHEHVLPPHSC